MECGKTLIERAGEKLGSFYKLAKEANMPEQRISEIRKGKRKLPLKYVPRLAEIAGENPQEWLLAVMAEHEKNPERKQELVGILGKALAACVAGILITSPEQSSASSGSLAKQSIHRLYRRLMLIMGRRPIPHPMPYGARLVGAHVAP